MTSAIQSTQHDSNQTTLIVTYSSLAIYILDIVTFTVGVCLVCRMKVGLERTLNLSLVITGVSLILKTAYNTVLFSTSTESTHKFLSSSALEVFLWNIQNKSISLINFVFLILIARSVSIIYSF